MTIFRPSEGVDSPRLAAVSTSRAAPPVKEGIDGLLLAALSRMLISIITSDVTAAILIASFLIDLETAASSAWSRSRLFASASAAEPESLLCLEPGSPPTVRQSVNRMAHENVPNQGALPRRAGGGAGPYPAPVP